MPNPGNFRHLVDVMGPGTRTPDGAGGYTEGAPVVVHGVWASVEYLTGTEQLRAMQTAPEASHRITLREWRAGITAENWVVFEERTFHIVAPPTDPEEKRAMLILLTREET